MAQARAHVPQFANLPAYTGSILPTKARGIVAGLTDLPPEKYILYLDPNVEASKPMLQHHALHRSCLTPTVRPSSRLAVQGHLSSWLGVLDQNGRYLDLAS